MAEAPLSSLHQAQLESSNIFVRRERMQTAAKLKDAHFSDLFERLSVKNDRFDTFYETSTREDYKALVDAALNGKLDGIVSVGRSGIYLNKCLIHPPTDA